MNRLSLTLPIFRRNARRASPIDGPFAETKEWVLAAAPVSVASASSVHAVRGQDSEIFSGGCRFPDGSNDDLVTGARCEEQ